MKPANTKEQEVSERGLNEVQQPLLDSIESDPPQEFNGPKGPEPTRYGDWERKGRCVDF